MSLSREKIIKIRPLLDRILVERIIEQESITAGGIVIPDQAKERAQIGKVIAVGPGRMHHVSGQVHALSVKVGDNVFFGKYSGTEVNDEFLLLKEDEILGII